MGKLLEMFKSRYVHDVYGSGGCETCGYGAEEYMSEDAYETLLAEIDKWDSETFGDANQA